MTPEWVLIIVAVIAALGGAAMGAIINQRGASQLARIAWERENQRREAEQAREDRYRLFDKRREAYASLYSAIGLMRRQLGIRSSDPDSEDRRTKAQDARHAYWQSYVIVRLIASDQILAIADRFLDLFDASLGQARNDSESVRIMQLDFDELLK